MLAANTTERYMPVPAIPRPQPPPAARSRRPWQRFHRKLGLWRTASALLTTCNAVYYGLLHAPPDGRGMKDGSASLVRAWEQSHSLMLREASRLRLGRRSSGLTGVHAARALLKVQEEQVYGSQGSPASRETLIADAIDEPACTSPVVNMLEALPAEDSLYYQDERNVVDATG